MIFPEIEAQIRLPEKLISVFLGDADVRWAKGGRGSAKTRSFAKMIAVVGFIFAEMGVCGQLLCGRQFMNSIDDSSLEECKRAIEDEPWLTDYYEVGEKYIKTKNGRVSFTFAGLERNIASIKSKGRILVCWVDEAEAVTESAWQTLIPTLREEGTDGDGEPWNAELWVTWNPKRKGSATDLRFGNSKDPRHKGTIINWTDNPKFPAILERQRLRDLEERPEQYDHIWGGDYVTVIEGAYYSKHLLAAKRERRIGRLAADPLMKLRSFWDIGGTGQKSDAVAIWIAQFIGKEIRWLNYYEAVGQPLATHITWLRDNGYDKIMCVLPHDAEQHEKTIRTTWESSLKEAGFETLVIPNQGAGAAMARVTAARRLFPQMWFDEEKCSGGLGALAWYHEKRDEERNIGLGPLHDWSSNGADAFGLGAVSHELLTKEKAKRPVPLTVVVADQSTGY